jgi:hypothetical protein
MLAKRVTLSDKPRHINIANYETRLRRLRTMVAHVVSDLDDALEEIEAGRKKEKSADDKA